METSFGKRITVRGSFSGIWITNIEQPHLKVNSSSTLFKFRASPLL